MKAISVGFTFRTRGLRTIREAVRMELDARRFEAQLEEVKRIGELSKARLQALAERAREIGWDK